MAFINKLAKDILISYQKQEAREKMVNAGKVYIMGKALGKLKGLRGWGWEVEQGDREKGDFLLLRANFSHLLLV